jgi:hypothetical protein
MSGHFRHSLMVLSLALACKGRSDFVDSARGDTTTPPVAGTFALDDFRRLRWIEGQWQGFMPDGKKFYEGYRFQDDSTIVKNSYADSTFRSATDTSRVTLRGGTVADEGGRARWVATRLDSTGVDFAPHHGATNHFTWARESGDKWNATLRWTDAQGRPQNVVYALRRMGR